ncbi:MAG: phosphatidylinositol mannoside acyltransferase [Actinomycetaceae bacterium]|nr:phosphatidylinositol mannoside acyltransferase [Actinomycetaceae bacterium]
MTVVRLFTWGNRLARVVPEVFMRFLFSCAAVFVSFLPLHSVKQLKRNHQYIGVKKNLFIRQILLAKACVSHFQYYYEIFRLSSLTPEQIDNRVRLIGIEKLLNALSEGSAIGALMHAGNWDLAGAWASRHVGDVHTIAEKLEPPELFVYFNSMRSNFNMVIYPLDKKEKPLKKLEEDMNKQTCFVPLLADRDLSKNGVEVDLCGEKIFIAPGPALLAQRTGRPIFPIFSFYEKISIRRVWRARTRKGMCLYVADPVYPHTDMSSSQKERNDDIKRMSQEWVSALQSVLLEHLEDWHMLHKVFYGDVDMVKRQEK